MVILKRNPCIQGLWAPFEESVSEVFNFEDLVVFVTRTMFSLEDLKSDAL